MEELLKKIAELDARLDAIEKRPPDRSTMKELRRCPACGCPKLLRTDFVRGDTQLGIPLALSVKQGIVGKATCRGIFELHVCTACGLVEWHALEVDPSILEDPKITLVEPPEDEAEGPYR